MADEKRTTLRQVIVIQGSQFVPALQLPDGTLVVQATTEETPPTAVLEGQVTLTGAAQQFPNNPCKSVTIENVSTNAVVYVGHDDTVSAGTGFALRPGANISLAIDNTNRIWVIGTAAQVITFIGVN